MHRPSLVVDYTAILISKLPRTVQVNFFWRRIGRDRSNKCRNTNSAIYITKFSNKGYRIRHNRSADNSFPTPTFDEYTDASFRNYSRRNIWKYCLVSEAQTLLAGSAVVH